MIQSFTCTAVNKLYAHYFNDFKKQCSTDNLLIRLLAKYNRPAHPTLHRCHTAPDSPDLATVRSSIMKPIIFLGCKASIVRGRRMSSSVPVVVLQR